MMAVVTQMLVFISILVLMMLVIYIVHVKRKGVKGCVGGYAGEVGIMRDDIKLRIIKTFNQSLDVCKGRCDSDSTCKGFNWSDLPEECTLFSGIPSNPVAVARDGPTGFYIKSSFCTGKEGVCKTDNYYADEPNIVGVYRNLVALPNITTLDECKKACTADPTCQAARIQAQVFDPSPQNPNIGNDIRNVCYLGFNGRQSSTGVPDAITSVKYTKCSQ